MNDPLPSSPDESLQQQREEIRRSLVRAHTAIVVIMLVVVGLAVAAIIASVNSAQNGRAAMAAAEKLWNTTTTQSKASRFGGEIGWRQNAWDAIATASRIRPSLGLRNEAIAVLATTDLQDEGVFFRTPPGSTVHTFDADLQQCAFVVSNQWIRVVQVAGGKETAEFDAPWSNYHTLQFSPDAHYLAARFDNGFLLVWDLQSKTTIYQEQPKSDLHSRAALDFTPDSRTLAIADSDGNIRFLSLQSGKEERLLKAGGHPTRIRFSPDGKTLAIAVGSEIELWDIVEQKRGRKFRHPADLFTLAWNPDGMQIAGGCPDSRVFLWNTNGTTPQLLAGHANVIDYVTFSPAGNLLASTSYDGSTRLWEVSSGRPWLATQRGFARQFSRDGKRLGYSRTGLGFGIWTLVPATAYRTISIPEGSNKRIRSVSISPDEKWLAAMTSDGLRLFNQSTDGRPVFIPLNAGRFAAFHPSGKSLVISTANEILIQPFPISTTPVSLPDSIEQPPTATAGPARHIPLPPETSVENADLSSDGNDLILRDGYNTVLRVPLDNPEKMVRFENYPNMAMPAISRDKKWIATGTFHGWGTRIWDAENGKPVHDLHGRHANVAFSNNGKWLVNAAADGFDFFTIPDWHLARQIPRDSAGELPGLAVFPRTGNSLAITKSQRLIQLVDPDTGAELASLNPPDPRVVHTAALSGDSGMLAVATIDGFIQLWDLELLRSRLNEIGLDWSGFAGPLPSSPPLVGSQLFFGGFNQLIFAVILGVFLTAALSILAMRHHRNLMKAYWSLDAVATERSRELARAQAAALHSQKMKALGTLAAGIAHDFNNLLSVIRMANQLTAEKSRNNPDLEENSQLVEKAVVQGKQVVNSMLGYSREPGAKGFYSVAELVEGTVKLLNQQFLSGIQLTLEIDRNLPQVSGVKNRLEQILLNLIVNAAEALDGQGRLHIAVRVAGEIPPNSLLRPRPASSHIEIRVADSGPGIRAEDCERIFEPFFTTKAVGATPGTGLGLSMVYSIAEEEGLGLALETVPGEGATFRIIVPV